MSNQITINPESTWYQHGWNMARLMYYGTEKQKAYGQSQYDCLVPQRSSQCPITAEQCSNFVAGWTKAMMD